MLKNSLFILTILLINFSVKSQGSFQLWTELGTKGKIYKDLDWTFELNNRFGSGYYSLFPQVGMRYKINSLLKVNGEYRLTYEKDDFLNYTSKNRFQVSLQAKERVSRFEVSGRLRYQYDFLRWRYDSFEQKTGHTLRFKPEVLYDIDNSPFSPFINGELFFPLFDLNQQNDFMDKFRLASGVEFENKSNHGLSISYIFEKPLDKQISEHILSLSYSYKF